MRGLEFYITNVCNLTCENCRSFNNYKFSGLYEFDQPAIQAWAEKIHITDISILGGEPTLHPRLEQWVAGLRAAWPLSNIRLTTNGTYLNKVRGLHDMLAKYRCNIQISSHSYELRNLIADEFLFHLASWYSLNLLKQAAKPFLTWLDTEVLPSCQ
jgi:molybdenum cofactor biosynthesis enzyme MoaA